MKRWSVRTKTVAHSVEELKARRSGESESAARVDMQSVGLPNSYLQNVKIGLPFFRPAYFGSAIPPTSVSIP